MRTLIFAIIAALAIDASGVLAQDDNTNNALQNKQWALQFQIGHNFTLRSFQGNVISLKRQLSEHKAWRFGIDFYGNANDADSKSRAIPPDTNYVSSNNNTKDFDIGFTTQYLRYASINDDIVLYYGAGPRMAFSYAKQINSLYFSKSTFTSNQWSAGINGAFGVEWFVRKNLSLLGEYTAEAQYRHTDSKGTTKQLDGITIINHNKSHGYSLEGTNVRFGLSVYFK